jgi:hypothetical protein
MNMEHTQALNPDESVIAEPMFDVVSEIAESASGPKVAARLIEYAPGRRIALPPHTVFALIEQPTFVEVPGAVAHAYGLLVWQNNRVPLLDLNSLLHSGADIKLTSAPPYALIVAYQSAARGPVAYGAIGLVQLPQTISVGDNDQCELPTDSKLWPQLALSCFKYEGCAVPILNTSRLFSVFGDAGIRA